MSQVKVVIAGGGTVGLATAVFLGHHGVPSVVLERRSALSVHPRALGISPRSLEFFREVGLGEEMARVAVTSTALWRATARTVAEIGRAGAPPASRSFFDTSVSPEVPRGHYPQNRIDSVLVPAAGRLGATIEFGAEVTGVEQDTDGVSVTLRDGRVITADYLIGADGANSVVRSALGVGVTGPGEIGELTMNILFDADLVGYFGVMPTMTRIEHPDKPGVLLAVGERRWVLHVRGPLSDEQCAAAVRTALGADAPFEIISTLPWRAAIRLADRFRVGRAFLVGDAARTISPLGAFGLNTGLADGHNLAWKLAMVIAGQAGDPLLDTYHDERHAVAEMVVHQALVRWKNPDLHWDQNASAERAAVGAWNAPLVTMGYRYDSSAIIDPVVELPSTEDIVRSLDGAPGSRLPHRWVEPGVSTLDLNRSGFAVLAGPAGQAWRDAATVVGLRAVVLDAEIAASINLPEAGALLVRPDGFVAWRTAGVADPDVLGKVLATVTGMA